MIDKQQGAMELYTDKPNKRLATTEPAIVAKKM